MNVRQHNTSKSAFTIVELLIVVVVIAILAAITIIAYNGVTNRAVEASLKTDLSQAAKKLETYKIDNSDGYPTGDATAAFAAIGYSRQDGTDYTYAVSGSDYCLSAATKDKTFRITNTSGTPEEGDCTPPPLYLQTITSANCPTNRTMAIDARDNHTYWVQELADGKCWMLTNLAYAGGTDNGGVSTYGDARALAENLPVTFTEASYYVHNDANPTLSPAEPSTNTAGGGSAVGGERQYGYLYNWCAAMGAPISTDPNPSSACANAINPAPDAQRSVCPAGWRVPTGNGGEFGALNTAVNGGLMNTDAGLRTEWLGQRGGYWNSGFTSTGTYGYYWTSTHNGGGLPYGFSFRGISINPTLLSKTQGFAVRCVAS